MARTKSIMKNQETTLEKPVWLKFSKEEVEAIIVKLANKGMTAEKIGLTLRDQYGIPQVRIYGIKIKDVLVKNGKFEEPTNLNLKKKLEKIVAHFQKNKGDKKAERSMIITKAKFKKRDDYFNRK